MTVERGADPELPGWRRTEPAPAQLRTDALGGVGLYLLSLLSLALGSATGLYGPGAGSLGVSTLVLAGVTLPLTVRRRWPAAVLGIVTIAFMLVGELPVAEGTISNIALFCALYTVGAWDPNRRRAGLVRAIVVSVMVIWLVVSLFRTGLSSFDDELPGDGLGALTPTMALMLTQLLVNALYFAGAWWFGSHSWSAARERELVEYRTAQLQAEQGVVARQAVTIERLRIARELHDAVAHHVSLMGVQAAAARAVIPRDPAAAQHQLVALEDSARSAVAELYNLLGTLREEPGEAPDGSGGPDGPDDLAGSALDVTQLPRLVEEAASSGLRADFEVVGQPRDLSPLIGLNLFRIGQEALTNVLKHTGSGTRTRVRLRYLPGCVELEIADDGLGRPLPRPRGGGLGLRGMRERVAAMRGTLTAEPRRTGGFLVRATVPDGVDDPGPGTLRATGTTSGTVSQEPT